MITILSVGKKSDPLISQLENHYLKQVKNLEVLAIKSFGDAHQEKEMQELTKKLSQYQAKSIFLLTENGKEYSSEKFSKLLSHQDLNVTFVISGALGFSHKFKEQFTQHLSLSQMTFPHKFARLLLIEQVYRGLSIINAHPYHK